MPEQTPAVLSHFSLLRFRDPFYSLSPSQRQSTNQRLLADLRRSAATAQVYQVYPTQAGLDLLIWSSQVLESPADPAAFFERLACATLPYRQFLEPLQALWGYTRPSQYTRARSTQELDPLSPDRKPYLVIYPFVKSADWYLLTQESRQGMMNGHIKIGKQFPEISQLLLYSFGLQDQEFVVVYEMDDLVQFSDLVYVLRDTDARRYTLRDAPLYTAIYHPAEQTLALWE